MAAKLTIIFVADGADALLDRNLSEAKTFFARWTQPQWLLAFTGNPNPSHIPSEERVWGRSLSAAIAQCLRLAEGEVCLIMSGSGATPLAEILNAFGEWMSQDQAKFLIGRRRLDPALTQNFAPQIETWCREWFSLPEGLDPLSPVFAFERSRISGAIDELGYWQDAWRPGLAVTLNDHLRQGLFQEIKWRGEEEAAWTWRRFMRWTLRLWRQARRRGRALLVPPGPPPL